MLLTRRESFCQKVSLVIMGIDIRSLPLIPGSTLANEVVGDALTLLLQDRVGNATAGQYGLIVSMNVRGTHTRDSYHSELVSKSS